VVTNDACQRPKRLIHSRGIREHLRHIRFQNDDVTASHAGRVGVSPTSTKIVLREDVIRSDIRRTPSASLLHSFFVRDESLPERL
jgi:hypothetical protein